MDLPQQRQRVAIDGLGNIGVGKWKIPVEKINLDDIIDLEDVNISKVIRSGKIELKINDGKQGKHIKGHNNYIEGRSYIIISSEEVQKLINKYAGTGMLIRTKNGKWAKQEVITTNTLIGYDVNDISGAETATKAFKIHYSNKGTHIVPKKE
ncbi:MAG: polymorphic toxin type 50 domain-containing protein [Pseudoruminococcus massiliensis]